MTQGLPNKTSAANSSPSSQSSVYDPLAVDAYALHLARVNETREVVASEDIYNASGALLVKKGTPITPSVTRAIVNFKLLKPISEAVAIAQEMDHRELLRRFEQLLDDDKSLRRIHECQDLALLLESQCLNYQKYPLLRQKITVLAERMPETFIRALYCAWLSLLIAKQMRLPKEEISAVFLAGLAHDIGMLHISPAIINKQGELSAEEWRQIQAHVVIGQKILQAVDGLSPLVSQAVLEHHERCDGTGYPSGKVESELCLHGQIIALADSVIAVYHNRFKAQGRSWRDVIPVIQMNTQAYFYRNYEVLVTVLRRSELPVTNVVYGDQVPEFIETLLNKTVLLKRWFATLKSCLTSVGYNHGDRKLHALQNVLIHIATAIHGSGLLDDGYVAWLEKVRNEHLSDAYREVEDAFLMQEEVTFHLQRLSRMTQIYLASGACKSQEIKQALEEGLATIASINGSNASVSAVVDRESTFTEQVTID
jgi:HD-GYP domain-containing protein (c-di-GMP phosphodiesterase class II)